MSVFCSANHQINAYELTGGVQEAAFRSCSCNRKITPLLFYTANNFYADTNSYLAFVAVYILVAFKLSPFMFCRWDLILTITYVSLAFLLTCQAFLVENRTFPLLVLKCRKNIYSHFSVTFAISFSTFNVSTSSFAISYPST